MRRFAEEVVRRAPARSTQSGEFPLGFLKQAAELGLGGVAVPEEYGGAGMDNLSYMPGIEESAALRPRGVILSVTTPAVCDPLLKFR